MRQEIHHPPREFSPYEGLSLRDVGDIWLDADEQITIRTDSHAGNDIVRKEWGFYLTNSLNANLRTQGLKTALVSSGANVPRIYVLLVEEQKIELFEAYLLEFNIRFVMWLDEWLESSTA